VSELQTPRASRAEWQDFEWDNDDATKTDIVVRPLRLRDDEPGQDALRRYTVCREVPYGGLPDVHLALLEGAAGFRRTVAVQRLRHEPGPDSQPTPGLSPDALLGCHVRHPNVIPVLDLIQVQGEFLLVMEYVISEPLTRLRAQGNRPPIPISVAIVSGILHALDAAHTARDSFDSPLEIVHAGLAPETVLVGVDGITRLIHFGISKKSRAANGGRQDLKGRPGYFAPEQVFDRRVDARTDVFAAAVLLWESLTGRALLEGDSPVDCMMRYLSRGARPPSESNPQVSERLDAVLARALEAQPERRFQSAAEFCEALEAAVEPASRLEVSRYVEGLAWVSIRDQRALLNETRPEEEPARPAALRMPVEAERTIEDLDEPTLIPGSIPYLNSGNDLVSHWAARRADEPTAVENRVPKAPLIPKSEPGLAARAETPRASNLTDAASDREESVSAPRHSANPALVSPAFAARVSSRAPTVQADALQFRTPTNWAWVFGTLGAALVVALVVGFRDSPALRKVLGREGPRAQTSAPLAAPRPALTAPPEQRVVPVPAASTLAASSESAESSKRVLRLDDLPLVPETPKAEAEAKPRVRKPVKWRKRTTAPAPSAAPVATHAEPAPTPEAETIQLDP
jgi:serine/threonine-protein kinase